MANFLVSYDLNGAVPTHAQMDAHIKNAGWACGRLLETVWYVGGATTAQVVYDYINSILSMNDRLMVITATDAKFRNLLVQTESLQQEWAKNA